jgi:alkyl sulfatase BDS1-like metallo-beta-lactamase superfamily hydrolase
MKVGFTKGALRRGLLAGAAWLALAVSVAAQQKDAEPATLSANEAFAKGLPLDDKADFDEARRGLVAVIPDGVVPGPGPRPAWNIKAYDFEQQAEPPATVNPSLWRQARLNAIHGLFKVTDRVYQARYDVSDMTIIEGDTGLILIDPLLSIETSRASLDLYYQNRPRKPVVAVIYTHSHADHFGGVKGVVSLDDVRSGKVAILAPDHFMDFAVSENVIAGNAMSRRAQYMYGVALPAGPRGQVDVGLGKALSAGTLTLIPPTDLIRQTFETRKIDGVEIEFHLVPGTEAPAEMVMYFPQFRVFDAAEIATRTMHNIGTLRGAEVRDARAWSNYLGEALERWGDRTDVLIAQHNWPTWGSDRVRALLAKQRDLYKFIHDQSVRLLNEGYTPAEIAETLKLPASLAGDWRVRGYYGTLAHNSKAVYQRYLGWYDSNPANLSPLPPVEQAKKTIDYMGGAEAVLKRAREDFKAGQYRWVATVANSLVFADPKNQAARDLGADALEQLGYQAESAPWRNEYLTGAIELRGGIPKLPATNTLSADTLQGISLDLLFDFLGVRLNAEKAEGKKIVLNWTFTDVNEKLTLNLENSALTHVSGKLSANADASFTLTRTTLNAILLKQMSFPYAIMANYVSFEGDPRKLGDLMGMLDDFSPGFPIIEPKAAAQ